MKIAVLMCCVVSLAAPVRAQSLLDKTPVDIAAGTVVSISRLGNAFIVTGKADLAVKGAPQTFEALLPLANPKLACSGGNWVKTVALSNVAVGFGNGIGSQGLPVSVDAHVTLCGVLLPAVDMRVTVPISPVPQNKLKPSGQYFVACDPDVTPIGFVTTSLEAFPSVRSGVVALIKKKITPVVAQLNAAVNRLVMRAASAGGGRAAVEAVTIDSDGSTLNLHVTFSGQVPTSKVSGWLGGI